MGSRYPLVAPMLHAMDLVRESLDRAIEMGDPDARDVLLATIEQLARAVDQLSRVDAPHIGLRSNAKLESH